MSSLQQLIVPGIIAGVFSVLVALTAAVFGRTKNNADAASSIAGGAKILADMSIDEVLRKDAKIVRLYAKLKRVRHYAHDLIERLEAHAIPVPPPPTAINPDDDEDDE